MRWFNIVQHFMEEGKTQFCTFHWIVNATSNWDKPNIDGWLQFMVKHHIQLLWIIGINQIVAIEKEWTKTIGRKSYQFITINSSEPYFIYNSNHFFFRIVSLLPFASSQPINTECITFSRLQKQENRIHKRKIENRNERKNQKHFEMRECCAFDAHNAEVNGNNSNNIHLNADKKYCYCL